MFQDSVPAGSYNDPFLSSVWNIWIDVKPLLKQGVDAWSGSHPPTKTLPFHGDMTKGRLCHVPASFSDMGCGQPKNHHAVSQISCFQISRFARFSPSVNLFHLALDMAMVPFQFFSGLFTDPFLSGAFGVFFARKMHSTSEFAKIVLSKCVIHAGFVTVAWALRGIPFHVGEWILDLISEFTNFQPSNSPK